MKGSVTYHVITILLIRCRTVVWLAVPSMQLQDVFQLLAHLPITVLGSQSVTSEPSVTSLSQHKECECVTHLLQEHYHMWEKLGGLWGKH
jgi:hypothetical protein